MQKIRVYITDVVQSYRKRFVDFFTSLYFLYTSPVGDEAFAYLPNTQEQTQVTQSLAFPEILPQKGHRYNFATIHKQQ